MTAPFVGRHEELRALGALIGAAQRAGTPAAALVTGEPGSGKTRLLGEVLARPGNPRTMQVVGFEPNQTVPLAAVGEVIRELATVPVHGRNLEGLVFGGRDRVGRAPLRIFEAAHRALSSYGPLLIGIDDLQWVDEQSIGFIQYLLRAASPTRQRLTVIAMCRPSPVGRTFRSMAESLLPAERRAVIDLGPMPLEDGLALARAIDRTLDETDAVALWRRAGGSPFWLDALARSTREVDPSRLIEERLRSLGADPSALLAMLAISARPFLLDELAELLEWKVPRTAAASAQLVSRGLGVEIGGTVRFSHDLIREAAAAGVPASARRRLHSRIADWIEGSASDDVKLLREALDHRVAAGHATAQLALRLIASPGRRLLNREDLRLLASISDGLEWGAAARVRIDRGLGELGAAIGEVDFALERWARVSEQSTEPSERRAAETEAARAAYSVGRKDEAHDHIDRARALSMSEGGVTVLLDSLEADVELWLNHETAAGSQIAQRALAGAEQMAAASGDLEQLSSAERQAYRAALEVAMDAAMQEGRDQAIPDLAERCVRVSAGLDDESQIAVQIRAGQALRTVALPREGEALDRQAMDASKRRILPMLTIRAGLELARALRDLGRLPEAHAVAVETRELEARLTDAPKHWGSAPSMRHMLELSIGDAAAALRELRRDAAAEPDPHYRQDIHLAIAVWQARVAGGEAAKEVEAELAAARADAELARCPRHSDTLALATVELLARIGKVDEAVRALNESDRRPGPTSVSRDLSRARATAAIAIARGDEKTAVATLEGYCEGLERAGLQFSLIWARVDLGRCLTTFDREAAVRTFTAAADLAERCGASTEGRLIAQRLRGLGVRAWRRGAASDGVGLHRLSKRELEISRRVADGASNREIADALVLAPKTVERHLTNILAKLGARNRTELAGIVHAGLVRGSPDE
jgi:DNA-binding CsgD family transcriptional regulator